MKPSIIQKEITLGRVPINVLVIHRGKMCISLNTGHFSNLLLSNKEAKIWEKGTKSGKKDVMKTPAQLYKKFISKE